MRKGGIEPFALLLVGLFGTIIISGIGFIAFYNRSTVSKRAMLEINIIEGINKVELTKIALSKALEYSFYQASYLTSPRGGFHNLADIDSFDCVPYWRTYGVINFPQFSSTSVLMLETLNNFAKELNKSEVHIPRFIHHFIVADNTEVTPKAFSYEKISLNREKLNIQEEADLEKNLVTNIGKMYYLGKEKFLDTDGVKESIENAINDLPPECKTLKLGDVCEDEILNPEDVFNKNCKIDWESFLKNKIKEHISLLNSNIGDIEIKVDTQNVVVSYKGECSGTKVDGKGVCTCKPGKGGSNICEDFDNNKNRCSDFSDYCELCPSYDVFQKCCPKDQCKIKSILPEVYECKDHSSTFTWCEEYYSKMIDTTCIYDYFASAIVSVEIRDTFGENYPVYDIGSGKTELKPITLKFRILSGNIYEDITNDVLANPSFEDGVTQRGQIQFIPNGWELVDNENHPEAVIKSNSDLPEVERIGQPRALILDGDKCYKIFNKFYTIDTSLKQTIHVSSGSTIIVDVPVQAHLHYEERDDYDTKVSQIGIILNGNERWFTGVDRTWVHAYNKITIPDTGPSTVDVDLEIRVKTKYPDPEGKDFFLDNIKVYKLAVDEDEILEPSTSSCGDGGIIRYPPSKTTTTTIPTTPTHGIIDYPALSSKYDNTRFGRTVDRLVYHYTAGGLSGTLYDLAKNPDRQASVHYVIDRDGTVYRLVSEEYSAWHAGCSASSLGCIFSDINPRSVGIEIVNLGFLCDPGKGDQCVYLNGKYWEAYPEEQIQALIRLSAGIIGRNPGIKVDRTHIIGHEEVYLQKSDPGPAFPWDEVISGIQNELNG